METLTVECSACGAPMEIPKDCYSYYLDCGIQHKEGECLK